MIEKSELSGLKYYISCAVNPIGMIGNFRPSAWYVSFIFPMMTFFFFFFQQSFDKASIGLADNSDAAMKCLAGFCTGAIISAVVASVIKFISAVTKVKCKYSDLVTWTGLTFFFPMFINITGTVANIIFSVNTSVLFGLTGILFSLIPLYGIMLRLDAGGEKKSRIFALCAVTCAGIIYIAAVSVILIMLG